MSQWHGQYANHNHRWYGGQWHSDWDDWGCWKSDDKWRSDWKSDDQWRSDWKSADQWQSKSDGYYCRLYGNSYDDNWDSWQALKEEGGDDRDWKHALKEQSDEFEFVLEEKPQRKKGPKPPATPPPAALLAKGEKGNNEKKKEKAKAAPKTAPRGTVGEMVRAKKEPKFVLPPKKRLSVNSLPEAWVKKPKASIAPVTLAGLGNEKTSSGPTLAGLVGDAETTPQDPNKASLSDVPPAPTFPKSAMPKAKSAAGWLGPKLMKGGLEAHTREAAQCFAASAAAAAGGLFIPLPPMPLLQTEISPDGLSGCNNVSSLIGG